MILSLGFDTIVDPVVPLPQIAGAINGIFVSFSGFTQQAFGSTTVVTTYTASGGGGGGIPGPANTPVAVKIYIAGTDRTSCVTIPLRRSWQLGSICTFNFQIQSALAGSYRPAEWDSVIVMLGAYRFFSGVVDNYEEEWHGGGAYYQITVNCVGWSALLERRYAGIDITDTTGATTSPIPPTPSGVPDLGPWSPGQQSGFWHGTPYILGLSNPPAPQAPSTLAQLLAYIQLLLTDAGITFALNGNDGNLTEQTFNWLSIAQILRQLEPQFDILFLMDMYKTIQVLNLTDGTGAAPVSILDSNGPGTAAGSVPTWQNMRIQRGGMYRNRQGERTSQQLNSVTSTTDPNGIITNESSRLSYVAWADDSTAQNALGFVVETIDDAKDIQDKSVLDAMATADLAQGSQTLVKVVIDTTLNTFQPGQVLTINTTIPPLSTDLLIEQIDSESSGPLTDGTLLMRHVLQASNSRFRRGAGLAYQQRLNQAATVPGIPLTGWGYAMMQAETITGLTNPGLVAGLDPKEYIAVRKGIGQWCAWNCQTAPANDVQLDLLANGVSIFATGRKPVIRAGNTFMINTDYAFVADPLKVPAGATLQQDIITTDTSFRDGVFTIMFAG